MRFGVDTGGTFTDVVARDANGRLFVHKLLSTPDDPSRAIAAGVHALDPEGGPVVHGTTVATNALLEREGGRVVFVATAGFEDLLVLRRQNRPELYALHVSLPEPLTRITVGVAERVAADGSIVEPLTDAEVARVAAAVADLAPDAVAICLLHAYQSDGHEAQLASAIRRELKGVHVSVSSELVREFREYERACTTVVNAYVGPVMSRYIERLGQRLDHDKVEVLQSSGGRAGLAEAACSPVHTVLSGPAGGVIGAFAVARELGFERIITFDMGGTSTDVSLCDGEPKLTHDATIADVPLRIPTLDILTVGAGGGSLAWVDAGGAMRVGPQRAGSVPGPAAYGRGGHGATVTDAHVVLGSLRADQFLGGEMRLDAGAARRAVGLLAETLELGVAETARGILDVADAAMARTIKVICSRHGRDPREFALLAFGGAGGLHGCRLAELMQMDTVVVPAHPGLLSAHGMLHAPRTRLYAEAVVAPLGDAVFDASMDVLLRRASGDFGPQRILKFSAAVRYQGQSFEIDVPVDAGGMLGLREAFDTLHEARFGYADRSQAVELVTMRLTVSDGVEPAYDARPEITEAQTPALRHDVDLGLGPASTTVVRRQELGGGGGGPMVITEYSGTTVVPAGWHATQRGAHLVLRRQA